MSLDLNTNVNMNIENFNISICSYNVYWKIMKNDSNPSINSLVKSLGLKKINALKSSILKNIFMIKNYYSPFVYCFQEAENYFDIINLFKIKTNNFKYYVGCSGPEHILTIWNSDILKKLFVIDGEFEKGRPFSLFVFRDLRFNSNFILINLHAGHNFDTYESMFKPIQHIINSNLIKISVYNPTRIIMCGDFNRDIGSQIFIEPLKYYLKISKKKFKFNSLVTSNKTCCNLNGYGYNKNCDQVIDSYQTPVLIYPLNKEKWYLPKSSDHIAIISIVKNFV